jgi:hypothetical protein
MRSVTTYRFGVRRRQLLSILGVILAVGAGLWLTTLRIGGGHTTPNWAGYVVQTSSKVSMVSGTWTIPTLDCILTPNARATTWVGVGGFGTEATWPFPQTGIDTNCVHGRQITDSWCSHGTFKFSSASAGDVITARLRRRQETWTCAVKNVTTGRTEAAQLNYRYNGIANTTEWIVENPTLASRRASRLASRLGTLADFRHMTFSKLKMAPQPLVVGNRRSTGDISMSSTVHGIVAWPSWSGNKMTVHFR